jgi:hypothetical protein
MTGVEVEHGLGATSGPFVVLRVVGGDVILLGQLAPTEARKMAVDMMAAAARAEYEGDLHDELQRIDMTDDAIGLIFHAVRAGEMRRETRIGGGDEG